MIKLDSKKYKPHNSSETNWLNQIHETINNAVQEDNLPFDYIRVGRQKKSWGSTGVARFKNEISSDGVGVWINGYSCADIDINNIIRHMVKSTCNWQRLTNKTTDEQKVFLKLKYAV